MRSWCLRMSRFLLGRRITTTSLVRLLEVLAAALALLAGGVARLCGASNLSQWAWAIGTALVLATSLWTTVNRLRRRELSVDLIAIFAMAGSLALGQFVAGSLIALMLTGGAALEAYASARALTALLKRAPRIAHRKCGEGLEDISVTYERRLGLTPSII
jgi:cation transport ATPase